MLSTQFHSQHSRSVTQGTLNFCDKLSQLNGNDGQAGWLPGKILYQNFILAVKTNSAETFIGLKCSKFIFTFLCSVWGL